MFFFAVWGRFGGCLGVFVGGIWGCLGSMFVVFWKFLGGVKIKENVGKDVLLKLNNFIDIVIFKIGL